MQVHIYTRTFTQSDLHAHIESTLSTQTQTYMYTINSALTHPHYYTLTMHTYVKWHSPPSLSHNHSHSYWTGWYFIMSSPTENCTSFQVCESDKGAEMCALYLPPICKSPQGSLFFSPFKKCWELCHFRWAVWWERWGVHGSQQERVWWKERDKTEGRGRGPRDRMRSRRGWGSGGKGCRRDGTGVKCTVG